MQSCSYDGHVELEVWSSFTRDPRDRQHRALRASDHDRSLVQQVLTEAYADGRLDRSEFDERSEAARTVRVLGDIDPLLGDLVATRPAAGALAHASQHDLEVLAHRHWERSRREAAFSFLGASTVTSAIWFATAWGDRGFEPYFFWPGFVIVVTLLRLVRTAMSRREMVEDEVRRLQKRQAKERKQPRGPLDWPW